jgi:hypothetical protein
MEDKERFALQAELINALNDGSAQNATPEKYNQWLIALATGAIPNEMVRHKVIVLGLTVNHLSTNRVVIALEETIKTLNAQNDKAQKTITRLTVITTILAVIATVATVLQVISIFNN